MLERISASMDVSPMIESEKPKRKDVLTTIMITAVVLILIGIGFAYVAKFEGAFDLSLKNITANGGLLFIACFSVRFLCKHIAMNKARQTDEYKQAQAEAKKATKEIAAKGYSLMIPTYTEAYSERVYISTVEKLLKDAKIPEEEYLKKYATKTKKEILSEFPGTVLSKEKWKALKEIRKIKRLIYDEKFLETESEKVDGYISPSDAFDARREDKKDDWKALLFSASLVLFSCSLAGTIIVDLSEQAIVMAVIKIVTTLFSGAFAIVKGWNIVMKKESGRFLLQTVESANCIAWCEKNK